MFCRMFPTLTAQSYSLLAAVQQLLHWHVLSEIYHIICIHTVCADQKMRHLHCPTSASGSLDALMHNRTCKLCTEQQRGGGGHKRLEAEAGVE